MIVVIKVKRPHRVLQRWEVLTELACFKGGTSDFNYPAVFNKSSEKGCFQGGTANLRKAAVGGGHFWSS